MLDTLDTPMLDFTDDTDVPMAGSSNESWLTSGMHIDEDGHTHTQHTSPTVLEVDMATYEETTEYEMLDEPAQQEPVDAEVVDVSFHESPQPSLMAPAPPTNDTQPIAPTQNSWMEKTEESRPQESNSSAVSDIMAETHSSMTEQTTVNESVPFPGNISSATSFSPQVLEQPSTAVDEAAFTRAVSSQPSEPHNHTPATEEPPITHPVESASSSERQAEGLPRRVEAAEVVDTSKQIADVSNAHPLALEQNLSESVHTSANGEPAADAPEAENYVDPPPPIHLSLRIGTTEGDQPDFVLFNLPESSSSSADEPLILLPHLPSLYYEPISVVFEAFRSEEYFSHLQELSEAEMAINAHELQLVISEVRDNLDAPYFSRYLL